MANTREIRGRIRSAKNVAKITRAMEMVSASKMRRAQRNVQTARPYVERLTDVMQDLAQRMVAGMKRGSLLEPREHVNSVAVVVVTPDRGLCGSLVANVLRRTARFILDQRQIGRQVEVHAIGKKGRDFINRNYGGVASDITELGDQPTFADTLGVSINVVRGFRDERYDEVYVVYSEFVNTLTQRATLRKLIPVELPDVDSREGIVDYTYEPGEEAVLRDLLPRYVEVGLYQAVLESIASEHSARMVAMQNATKNAKDLVRDLTLTYNKVRQTSITNEVSEIATGAAALEERS
jgi:F-type H+-transporting ATPase subunit gamma